MNPHHVSEALSAVAQIRDQRIAELEAQVAELTADRERLDWLESVGFATHNSYNVKGLSAVHFWVDWDGKMMWTATYISSEFRDCRAAIDAARKAAQG